MGYQNLICDVQDQIALVTLNRPDKRNALSRALRDDIVSCLNTIEPDAAVIVLTGAGSSFCAGFDLSEFQSGDMQEIFAHATAYHHKVYNTRIPIVAAVNGQAVAGGMDLAAMCDIRVASRDAVFGQPQVKMGIEAAYDLLRTVLAESRARELCLTGRLMGAEEAFNCDFVNEIIDSDGLLERALQLAGDIAASKGSKSMKSRIVERQPDLFV